MKKDTQLVNRRTIRRNIRDYKVASKFTSININKKITIDGIFIEVFKMNLSNMLETKSVHGVLDKVPGVYCFYNENQIYVGESVHPFTRIKQHVGDHKIKTSDEIIIFRSEQFHKSAIYDLETKLIDLVSAEQKYQLINEKLNQSDYQYFLKEIYQPVLEKIWNYLREDGLVKFTIPVLKDREAFKLSPYKSLNANQKEVVEDVLKVETKKFQNENIILVKGYPGTGKSIVASNLYLNASRTSNVVLTTGTHPTVNAFKRVFKLHNKTINTNSKILNTRELLNSNENFDLVIIDEAHRLLQKDGKGHGMKYAHINHKSNELEMILDKYKNVVLFFDQNQLVHDGDIDFNEFEKLNISKEFELVEQMRSQSGYSYISNMISFLNGNKTTYKKSDYLVASYESFSNMYKDLRELSKKNKLTRLLSGYSRPWISKNDKTKYDFEIDGISLQWNYDAKKWIHSDGGKKLKEVGYYHSVQGFDLGYAGIIIGRDLYMDKDGVIQVNENFIPATNEKPKKSDTNYYQKLRKWTINRYIVLLSRGAKGALVYIEDEKLKKAFGKIF